MGLDLCSYLCDCSNAVCAVMVLLVCLPGWLVQGLVQSLDLHTVGGPACVLPGGLVSAALCVAIALAFAALLLRWQHAV